MHHQQFLTTTLLLAVLAINHAHAADQPVIVKIPRMTMETAERIAQGAIAECRKVGIQIGVTVIDRGGHPVAVLRDTLAPDLTLEISRQKAYTAMSFNAVTSTLEDRFTKPFSVGKVPGLVFSAGGVPISAAGNIVGAVGVSGAPTGEQDEKCAQAGLQKVSFDLESAEL
jgi:uncharacterized protein GlcG (DUF336 family)